MSQIFLSPLGVAEACLPEALVHDHSVEHVGRVPRDVRPDGVAAGLGYRLGTGGSPQPRKPDPAQSMILVSA